jgi:hypothetical protein
MHAAAFLLAVLAVAACEHQGTLDNSPVEYTSVEGRKIEVRVASTGRPNEYRLLAVRDTIVIDPEPANERRRAWEAARRFIDRTCKGRPYEVLEERLAEKINLYLRFRCAS